MNSQTTPRKVERRSLEAAEAPGPERRRVGPGALEDVQRRLGNASRQRDELIEQLHKIQDSFGHLSSSHLAALAHEMRLAPTEVYEIASFYHQFDIVKEGDMPPPALTVRVCDDLSCGMAGARALLARLPTLLGQNVRVIAAPCIGRCEQARAVAVGQTAVPNAICENVAAQVVATPKPDLPEGYID